MDCECTRNQRAGADPPGENCKCRRPIEADVDGIKLDCWVRASREFTNVDVSKLYHNPVVQLMLTHAIEVANKEAKESK